MSTGAIPTTQKQGWLSSKASTAFDYTLRPLYNYTDGPLIVKPVVTVVSYSCSVYKVAVFIKDFIKAQGTPTQSQRAFVRHAQSVCISPIPDSYISAGTKIINIIDLSKYAPPALCEAAETLGLADEEIPPPALKALSDRYGLEERAKLSLGEKTAGVAKRITTQALHAFFPKKIVYFHGLDLNPLHMRPTVTSVESAAATATITRSAVIAPESARAEKREHCRKAASRGESVTASLPGEGPATRRSDSHKLVADRGESEVPAQKRRHQKSVAVVSIPEEGIAAPRVPRKHRRKTKAAQQELNPANIKKCKDAIKLEASRKLYPIIINYARAYFLNTSVLGIEMDGNGLMAIVEYLKMQQNNDFDLTTFKRYLVANKKGITRWQSIKLYLSYYLLISWVSKLLIPSLCNKGIDLIYDHLFGENGKQEQLLLSCTQKLAEFFEKYTDLLIASKAHRPEQALEKKDLEKEQEVILGKLINLQHTDELYSNFADTLVNNFLPPIGKSLVQFPMKWIKQNIKCREDSSVITKGATFIVRSLAIIPLKFIQFIGWLIETSIKNGVKSLITKLCPTIVASVKSLQSDMTQLNLQESLLKLLRELKTSLEHPSTETAKSVLPLSAAENPEIKRSLENLATKLAAMLALSASETHVKVDTILERAIRTSGVTLVMGERAIDQVISQALNALVPEACITTLSKLLHPREFTTIVSSQIDLIAAIFSPTPPFDEAAKRRTVEIKMEINQVIFEISKLSIQLAVKDAAENQLPKLLSTILPDVEFDRVPTKPEDPTSMIDIENMVERLFVPRVHKYIGTGIGCVLDEGIERFGILHIMKIVNAVFGSGSR